MTRARILVVVKGMDVGGIERIVCDQAAAFRRCGVDVDVAVVNDRRDALVPTLEASGATVHRLGGGDRIGWRAGRRLRRLVGSSAYAAVHAHGPLPSIACRLAPRGGPLVTTVHTMWPALRRPVRALLRATAGRDAATVAVSAAVVASLPAPLAARTQVVPHGIDPVAVSAVRDAVGRRPDGEPVVAVTVASHRDVKNYPNLLLALAAARRDGADLRLVAVGDGPARGRHQQLADELGVDDVVDFRDPVVDVLPVIAAADLLVVASDFEGQPLVVGEALALGVPVVATAVGRVPEMVGPDVGRVVRPRDPAALGAALAELAADADLRRSMAEAAPRAVSGWTVDDEVRALLALTGVVV